MSDFSLVLPCYNGFDSLKNHFPELLRFFQERGLDVEVIVVDDGSKNGAEIERIVATNNATYIKHHTNKGKGASVRSGVLQASAAHFILFTDVDIPFQYQNIIDVWQELKKGADVVVGNRKESGYAEDSGSMRKQGSRWFRKMVRGILGTDLGDTQCGLKGFSAKAAKCIFPISVVNGFAADVEWLYLAGKNKFTTVYVSVELRNNDKSTVRMWKHVPVMLADVLRIRLVH